MASLQAFMVGNGNGGARRTLPFRLRPQVAWNAPTHVQWLRRRYLVLCASARAESISKRAPSVRTSAPLNASGSQRLGGRDGRGPLKTPNSAWNATVQRTDAWRPPPGS